MRTINKKDLRDLRKLANMLPPLFEQKIVTAKVYGHELINEDSSLRDKDGERIKPEHLYVQKKVENIPMNGYKKLKSVYLNEGAEGVKRFMDKATGVTA